MERNIAANSYSREAWEGGVVVHSRGKADAPSSVPPELVLSALDGTVSQHGAEVGRDMFKLIFKSDSLFDDRYGIQPPEAPADIQ